MGLDRVVVKLTILVFLVYWLTLIGGRTLTPVYLMVILFCILSMRYTFIPHQETLEAVGVFALGAAIRGIMIRNNPNPPIDIYVLCSQAIDFILHGTNPYTATYTIPPEMVAYGCEHCAYPPLMLLTLMPAYVLARDIRYSILVADLAVAYLLFRSANDRNLGLLAAVLYLLNPLGASVVKNAWNEAVLTLFLLTTLVLWKNGKRTLSAVFLGMSVGVKQFAILLIPFMWKNYTKREIVISVVAGLAAYMPFIAISPHDLVYDVFLYFDYVRYDSKSLIPFLLRGFWSDPTTIPVTARTILSLIQLSITGYTILRLLNKSTATEEIAYAFGLTYFTFIILSPISNLNYFYLLPPFFALGIEEMVARGGKETTTSIRDFFSNLIPKFRGK